MRRWTPARSLIVGISLALLTGFAGGEVPAAEPARSLVITGAGQALGETPIVVEVDPTRVPAGRYRLTGPGPEAPIAAISYRDEGRAYLGFVVPGVAPAAPRRLTIELDPTPAPPGQGVELTAEGDRVAVTLDGQPWTTYVPDDGPKPYFDRLVGPTGASLTRAWPMREVAGEPHDHPHHRSLWFAHFDVNKANTWDQNPGHGSIRATGRPTMIGGGPVGVLRTTDDWLDRAGTKVCTDERIVRFYATRTARVFDFEVTLKATAGPIKIGDNKDGVFAVRVAAPMAVTAKQGGRIVNARGLIDKAAWGQPAEWVDYTGPVGGATMGIAILNHPTSFRYPTTWHVRDYGLFAANPFGWHDFGQPGSGEHAIEAGGSIRLAYRVVLHQGDADQAAIRTQFLGYAEPPQVTVE